MPTASSTSRTARVLSLDAGSPVLPLVEGGGSAVAVVWPGNGASFRTMHHVTLEGGAATVVQRHEGEAVYYVKSGSGHVQDPDGSSDDPLVEGSMVFVEPGTAYRFVAADAGMVVLGGPCPADPALYPSS